MNSKLPDEKPAATPGAAPVQAKPKPGSSAEVPSRLLPLTPPPAIVKNYMHMKKFHVA